MGMGGRMGSWAPEGRLGRVIGQEELGDRVRVSADLLSHGELGWSSDFWAARSSVSGFHGGCWDVPTEVRASSSLFVQTDN